MIAPPIPVDEAQRQATLRLTRMLDSAPEERFDRVTRMACRLFGVPIALVSLIDANRQWFKSRQGLAAAQTSREISFCAHAILSDEPLIVEDALKDVRFFDNPLVTEGPGIRFYAGYPLAGTDGRKIGTLCIISNEPRRLSPDDKVVLRTLAMMVECELGEVNRATSDTITGLANLRGCLEIGDCLLRIASRLKSRLHVLLLHLESPAPVKTTNDAPANERHTLKAMAAELLRGFPESDLVARIGPRDFAVLLSNCGENPVWDESGEGAFLQRLKTHAVGHVIAFDPLRHASLEEVVSEAESFLKQKRVSAAIMETTY